MAGRQGAAGGCCGPHFPSEGTLPQAGVLPSSAHRAKFCRWKGGWERSAVSSAQFQPLLLLPENRTRWYRKTENGYLHQRRPQHPPNPFPENRTPINSTLSCILGQKPPRANLKLKLVAWRILTGPLLSLCVLFIT